jgi:chloride channel 6
MGGFAGGCFNWLNHQLSEFRKKYFWGKRWRRWLEAIFVAFMTSVLLFSASLMVSDCKSNDGIIRNRSPLVKFNCDDDHHSPMATLAFNTIEGAIHNLFHNEEDFGPSVLIVYFVFLFICAVVTYGIAVPSGLIDPSAMCGAAMGRLVGEFVKAYIYTHIKPGTYAIVGACAFLGGVTRITLAVAILMLMVTNNISYLLPLMMVTLLAKLVGDRFGISLYDIHIELKNMPFIETRPHKSIVYLTASDRMVHPVICFKQVENALTIYQILLKCKHNGFPVLND